MREKRDFPPMDTACFSLNEVASATGRVQLGAYQEVRIRHMHQTLDRYLADPTPAA